MKTTSGLFIVLALLLLSSLSFAACPTPNTISASSISASGSLIKFDATLFNGQCSGYITAFKVWVNGKYDGQYSVAVAPSSTKTYSQINWDEYTSPGSTNTLKICIGDSTVCSTKSFTTSSDQCSSGVCCDTSTKKFKSASTVCDSQYDYEYGCYDGSSAGDDVYLRYQKKYCSGSSSSCDGSTSWGSWEVDDYCGSSEKCMDGYSTCQPLCKGESGWKCKDSSTVGYYDEYCSWSSVSACSSDKYCSGGSCVLKSGCQYNNPACSSNENCVDNTCVLKSGCQYNNPACGSSYNCVNNQCVLKSGCAYNNPACTSNYNCVDNTCVLKSGCQYNNPACGSSYNCVNNQCVLKSGCNYNNPACGSGEDCVNNQCVPKCQAGTTTISVPVSSISASGNLIKFDATIYNGDCASYVGKLKVWVDGVYDGVYSVSVAPKTTKTYSQINWDQFVAVGNHELKVCVGDTAVCDTKTFKSLGNQCTSGVCCDTTWQLFMPSSAICNGQAQKEYSCLDGSDAGDDVYGHYRKQFCSGSSYLCNGALSGWGSWEVADVCAANEKCINGYSTCQPACKGESGWKCKDSSTVGYYDEYCSWSSVSACSSDKYCSGGSCVLKSGCQYNNPACNSNQTCSNNQCVPKTGCAYKNPPCSNNEYCHNNVCKPLGNGCAYNNPPCSSGYYCSANVCKKIINASLCTINSAKWSVGQTAAGTSVDLIVNTSAACNGKTASFAIYEDDTPLASTPSFADDFILTKKASVSNGIAKVSWVPQYIDDQWGDPEFVFNVTLEGKKAYSGNLKVGPGGFITFSTLKQFYFDKSVTIVKGTGLSQQLEERIADLKKAAQLEATTVIDVIAGPKPNNCYTPNGLTSSSLIIIGNENNNQLFACTPEVDTANGMYFQGSLWADPNKYGMIWIRTNDSDESYDNVVAMQKMFEYGVNDDFNLWDSSVACVWSGDYSKAASPVSNELACNVIPVVELAPDVRDVWNYCVKSKEGTVGKTIDEWDVNAYINSGMCTFSVIALKSDIASLPTYLGIVTGLPEAVADVTLSTFRVSLKNVIKNAFGIPSKKAMIALGLKNAKKVSIGVLKDTLDVVKGSPEKIGDEFAETILKVYSYGDDVATDAITKMEEFTAISKITGNSGFGWDKESINGMGALYKMAKSETKVAMITTEQLFGTTKKLTSLSPDNAKRISKFFADEVLEQEVKTTRKALGTDSYEVNIYFGDEFMKKVDVNKYEVDSVGGLTWYNPDKNLYDIGIKGKPKATIAKVEDSDFIMRYFVIHHELGEEALMRQLGFYTEGKALLKQTQVNEFFVENLLVTKAGLGSGNAHAEAFAKLASETNRGYYVVTEAFSAENLGLVSAEYGIAVKHGNTQYAENLVANIKSKLLGEYGLSASDPKTIEIVDKVTSGSAYNKMVDVGDKITSGQLKAGDVALETEMDALENELKTLELDVLMQ